MDYRAIEQSFGTFELENTMKNISLFGYGKTMQEIAKYLARNGQKCSIFDDKFSVESSDEFGNILLPSARFNPLDSDLEIISPGIPPHCFLVKQARNLISEYDYFKMPFSVWISGTNGKTTTTQMAQFMLQDFGAQCGGNIGTPLCCLDSNAKMWILETSSFSLHYTTRAVPNIYALLPITPDHLAWHGDFCAYKNAKLKPLSMMSQDSIAIIPSEFMDSPQACGFEGKIYFYKNALDLSTQFNIPIQQLKFKGAFGLDCALALAIYTLITKQCDFLKINDFNIDSHKMQEFSDAHGRLFVDDSKATNIDAVLCALEVYKKYFIFLILGGDNKGVDLEPLIAALKQYKTRVFAIGACAGEIEKICEKYLIECQNCERLENAVRKIKKIFKNKNEICILSPACASLDQFSGYKERGERFQSLALE